MGINPLSSNFLPILRFIAKTMVHKAYVIRFGLKTKAPLFRLLIHDWTKFTPAELPHYARRHYGSNDYKLGFSLAWNHHSKSKRLIPFAQGHTLYSVSPDRYFAA